MCYLALLGILLYLLKNKVTRALQFMTCYDRLHFVELH